MSDEITFENYDKPVDYNLKRLEGYLSGISTVVGVQHRLSERFVQLFRENFFDLPFSSSTPINTSNWTHHTYFAIRTTAKALFLDCTFETMGRLDAVIETTSEYPGVILLAEWESKAFSVFGANNELDKLWTGVNQYEHADAFLFTYCSLDNLFDFTKKVVEFWQSKNSTRQNPRSLFLTIVVTRRIGRIDEFIFMRSIEIRPTVVLLWYDLAFVTLEEYKNCAESI